jgi:hypothetical protein
MAAEAANTHAVLGILQRRRILLALLAAFDAGQACVRGHGYRGFREALFAIEPDQPGRCNWQFIWPGGTQVVVTQAFPPRSFQFQ